MEPLLQVLRINLINPDEVGIQRKLGDGSMILRFALLRILQHTIFEDIGKKLTFTHRRHFEMLGQERSELCTEAK